MVVMDGRDLFRMHDQEGFSLTDSCWRAAKCGVAIDTDGFIRAAIKAGWKPKKALAVVKEALSDTPKVQVAVGYKPEPVKPDDKGIRFEHTHEEIRMCGIDHKKGAIRAVAKIRWACGRETTGFAVVKVTTTREAARKELRKIIKAERERAKTMTWAEHRDRKLAQLDRQD